MNYKTLPAWLARLKSGVTVRAQVSLLEVPIGNLRNAEKKELVILETTPKPGEWVGHDTTRKLVTPSSPVLG
jgi:hypothetical protein